MTWQHVITTAAVLAALLVANALGECGEADRRQCIGWCLQDCTVGQPPSWCAEACR